MKQMKNAIVSMVINVIGFGASESCRPMWTT